MTGAVILYLHLKLYDPFPLCSESYPGMIPAKFLYLLDNSMSSTKCLYNIDDGEVMRSVS